MSVGWVRQGGAGGRRVLQVSWRWEAMPDRRMHDEVCGRVVGCPRAVVFGHQRVDLCDTSCHTAS